MRHALGSYKISQQNQPLCLQRKARSCSRVSVGGLSSWSILYFLGLHYGLCTLQIIKAPERSCEDLMSSICEKFLKLCVYVCVYMHVCIHAHTHTKSRKDSILEFNIISIKKSMTSSSSWHQQTWRKLTAHVRTLVMWVSPAESHCWLQWPWHSNVGTEHWQPL